MGFPRRYYGWLSVAWRGPPLPLITGRLHGEKWDIDFERNVRYKNKEFYSNILNSSYLDTSQWYHKICNSDVRYTTKRDSRCPVVIYLFILHTV